MEVLGRSSTGVLECWDLSIVLLIPIFNHFNMATPKHLVRFVSVSLLSPTPSECLIPGVIEP